MKKETLEDDDVSHTEEEIEIVNDEDSLQYCLHVFQDHLLKAGVISTPIQVSRTGETHSFQKWKCIMVNIIVILCIIRHALMWISGGENNTNWILSLVTLDIFSCLGRASRPLSLVMIIANLQGLFGRCLFLWIEGKKQLFPLYFLFDLIPREPQNNEETQPEGASESDDEDAQFFKKAVKISIRCIDFVAKVLAVPLFFAYLVATVMSSVQRWSLWFTLLSPFYFILSFLTLYDATINVTCCHVILWISVRYLSRELNRIRQMIIITTSIVSNTEEVFQGVSRLSIVIRNHNILINQLLRISMIILSSALGLAFFICLIPGVPEWFSISIAYAASIYTLLFNSSFYFAGSLFTQSRSMLQPLYSSQVRLMVMQEQSQNKDVLKALIHCRKIIKQITSESRPICFSLPDGTPFTPLTSTSCLATTISNTLMLLTSNIVKLY